MTTTTVTTPTRTTMPAPPLALSKTGSSASSSGSVRRGMNGQLSLTASLGDKVSIISGTVGLNFVICDCPTDRNLDAYIGEFAKNNVKHIVRLCESPYSSERLQYVGIQVPQEKDQKKKILKD